MKAYFRHLVLLAKRLLLVLIMFQVSRLFFLLLNLNYFESLSFTKGLSIFFFGTRFDLSALCFFYSIFILLHIVPGKFKSGKKYQLWLKWLFVIVSAAVLLFNFTDAEYFKFINKRSTFDIFRMLTTGDDFLTLLPRYLTDFWYIPLSWLLLITGAWFVYPPYRYGRGENFKSGWHHILIQALLIPVILGICFIGIRGIKLRPLAIKDASYYTTAYYAPLLLNTPFTLYCTFLSEDIERKEYFTEEEREKIFSPEVHISNSGTIRKDNVIVIILESFSKEYSGSLTGSGTHTPFLDSLVCNGLAFRIACANGLCSLSSVPAIISSLPDLMNTHLSISRFASNEIMSIPGVLKKYGYSSAFFHGGTNGTMGFDSFAMLAGFDNYYGRYEYNNEEDYDGCWGIYDEEFLQYTAETINSFSEPFFATIYTLSSHHPFEVPPRRRDMFKPEDRPILATIRYTDFALKKFFETASAMPWFGNTLFVITADHTSGSTERYYMNNMGRYLVPLIYYHPSDSSLTGFSDRVTQHADIFPSVLDYLNMNEEIIAYGTSVFDTLRDANVITYNSGLYQLVTNSYLCQFDGLQTIGLFDLTTDSLLTKNLMEKRPQQVSEFEKRIKAVIQSYNNRMLDNNLVLRNKDNHYQVRIYGFMAFCNPYNFVSAQLCF